MAKKKRATALFDVISQSKRYQRPAMPRPTSGPSWWPFGRRRVTPLVSVAAINSPVMAQAEPGAAAHPAPLIPVHRTSRHETMDESHDTCAPAAATRYERNLEPVRVAPAPLPTVEDPLHKPLHLAVDPQRKVIAFRMNYTVAIVGGFALVVAIALAVIVGQHLRGDGTPVMAQSLQKLQAGPTHPEALTPAPRRSVPAASTAGSASSDPASPASQQTARNSKAKPPTFNEPRENNFTVVDGKRQIGLNYVVIQMYAANEEKGAQEASEFLNRNGVPCTIEKGIKGWPPSAFVLVGTKGFDRISTAPFKEYMAQIDSLSNQFTSTPKENGKPGTPRPSYKAFQPSPKKWDKLG